MKKFTKNITISCILAFFACVYVTNAVPSMFFAPPLRRGHNNGDGSEKFRAFVSARSTQAFLKTPDVCSDCVCGVGRRLRIVGGNFTTINNYPWMVGILRQGQFHCGGSLISRNHVLTAAHCLHDYDKTGFELRMGGHDITETAAHIYRRRVKSWEIHDNFNPYNLDNDIAIIKMDRPVKFDGVVRSACLPRNSAIDYAGSMATAIGWGRTKEGADVSEILQHVNVPVLSEEECEESGYPTSRRTGNMFCAGFLEGAKDACSGDSGGPLLVRSPTGNLEIIGITSFGRGCARPRFPGVYTKLTNYLGWLRDQMKNDCVCSPPHRY